MAARAEARDRWGVWCRWERTPERATAGKVWCGLAGAQAWACRRREMWCCGWERVPKGTTAGKVWCGAQAEARDRQEVW